MPGHSLSLLHLRAPLALLALFAGGAANAEEPYDQDPISYSSPETDDVVARLQKRLDADEARLEYDPDRGYLPSLLKLLDVSATSQTLVFSKTSFQRDRISPQTPRALYFNDDVYIGSVTDGEVLEISAVDPQKGAIFYTLPQRPLERATFRRQTHECLQCHDSSLSQGVPGHIIRSVFPDSRGQAILSAGTFVTDHRSPLKERWGGWYVTGTHGEQRHLGNRIFRESDARDRSGLDLTAGANVTDLAGRCDAARCLTGHSDIVALMVLEHQTYVHNLITRANHQTRLALRDEEAMNRALGRPADHRLDSTSSRIKSAGEPLVRALLFVDEAPLTERVTGTADFAAGFSSRGPRDSRGRSLRDFDLERRLFRYPCSYLIYSPAFAGLPGPARDYVARRLSQILSGDDPDPKFSHLSSDDRQAILEILRETLLAFTL